MKPSGCEATTPSQETFHGRAECSPGRFGGSKAQSCLFYCLACVWLVLGEGLWFPGLSLHQAGPQTSTLGSPAPAQPSAGQVVRMLADHSAPYMARTIGGFGLVCLGDPILLLQSTRLCQHHCQLPNPQQLSVTPSGSMWPCTTSNQPSVLSPDYHLLC